MKKYVKSVISLFLVFVLIAPCVFVARADYSSNYYGANWWDWIMSQANKVGSSTMFSGIVQDVTGHLSGKICPFSSDSYHHSSLGPNLNDLWIGNDSYGKFVKLPCEYCGQEFKAYYSGSLTSALDDGSPSDLQQSYDTQVSQMPATGYTSNGGIIWQPTSADVDAVYISGDDNRWGLQTVPASIFDEETGYFQSIDYNSSGNGFRVFSSSPELVNTFGNLYFSLRLSPPLSGYYRMIPSQRSRVQTTPSDNSPKAYYYEAGSSNYRKAGVFFDWDLGLCMLALGLYYTVDIDIWFPYFEVVPDTSLGDIYNINSRPSSISGDYGIIGDNGQITKVDSNTIFNETNNSYYNPVTGETHTMSDWSYNYVDRSYTFTNEKGDTVTITYGDENIIIKEGDTIYNVYYIIEGSGSGGTTDPDPGPGTDPDDPVVDPDPDDPCNHHWEETSYTPATCTVGGSRFLTCSLCGETRTETIPAPGHTWTIKQTVTTQYDDKGNLIQEGYTIYECSVCGEQYKTTDGTAPPGDPGGFGSSSGIFSGIFGLLLDFLSFFWNTFREFVGEGVKGFLTALMDGTSSIFGLLNPFNWGD